MAHSVAQTDIEHGRLIRILPDREPEPLERHASIAA
jgi:hypothetical protein